MKAGKRRHTYLQGNELTPAGLLLVRYLRQNGLTIDIISRSMKISRQTVIAQTTSLGIVPIKDAVDEELQKHLLRELFAKDCGLELEGEYGQRLFSNIRGHVIDTAAARLERTESSSVDVRELNSLPLSTASQQ